MKAYAVGLKYAPWHVICWAETSGKAKAIAYRWYPLSDELYTDLIAWRVAPLDHPNPPEMATMNDELPEGMEYWREGKSHSERMEVE